MTYYFISDLHVDFYVSPVFRTLAILREYTDTLGKRHLLLCNPVGYPDENPFAEHGLKREDFLVEME